MIALQQPLLNQLVFELRLVNCVEQAAGSVQNHRIIEVTVSLIHVANSHNTGL